MEPRDYAQLVRPLISGRRFLLALGPAAGATRFARGLRELGAERSLILGQGPGTGDPPDPADATWYDVMPDAPPLGMMEGIREYERRLNQPSSDLVAAIEAFDPEGRAVVRTAFWSDVQGIAGRRTYAARRPEWRRLEDKVAIEEVWKSAGVTHAPSRVCAAEAFALRDAARALDRGEGTVWSGDTRDGFNGGATYVRWIRREADASEAAEFFHQRCDRVRIMPYLRGIPCSICGIVFPDTVVALRPVEMVVFSRPEGSRFLYAGASTYWDPPEPDRQAMRRAARDLGEHLRRTVGYRGTFVIDGVLTRDGFLPTELNAREGASMGLLDTIPDLPLGHVLAAVREGEDLDFQAAGLGERLVASADVNRRGGGWSVVGRPRMEETVHRRVEVRSEGPARFAEEGEGNGVLVLGPSATGGFLRFTPDPGSLPHGPSVAPVVASVFALADRELGTDFGELVPAEPA